MNRGDKLEGQIRAVLAAEASTRRLVAVRRRPAAGARLVRGALVLGAAVFLIIGAVAIGSTVRALRSSPVASEPQSAQAQPRGVCASAEGRLLGLSGIITRLERIAVKRMTVQDLDAGRDPLGLSRPATPLASNTVLCVVAVGGEIRQSFGVQDTGPASWAVFVSVAGVDDPIVSSSMGSNRNWPPYFDGLPDRVPNPYPGTVVEVVGQDALRVRLESAVLSAEFGNPVLVEANKYTLIQPPAATVSATGVAPGDRVAIVFEREGRSPTSGAYALSTLQLLPAVASSPPGPPGVVLDVRTGTGASQPGVVPGGRGPSSLAVDDGGRIYLFDAVNGRILVYEAGQLIRTVTVAIRADARELEVLNGKLYLAAGAGTTRQEWEVDAATGATLRTTGGGQPTLYQSARTQYPTIPGPTYGPAGTGPALWPIGSDRYGNQYVRFVDTTCSRGAARCAEIRRLSVAGSLLASADEPAGIDIADYYVSRDGAVYELRNDRVGSEIVGIFVIRLMSAIT